MISMPQDSHLRRSTVALWAAVLLTLLLTACTAPAPQPVAPATAAPETSAPVATEVPAAPAAAANQVVIAPGSPIRIGGSVALTGPIPDPGKDIRHGAELAVDDLNAAGGIKGFMVELVVEDGGCDGNQGTVVANKFAATGNIVAVSGGTCSGETLGLKPILQTARIPFVSPSATNPAIVSPECDVCNRVALSDSLQGKVDAQFVYNQLQKATVAVMHDNSDYGKGLAEIFQADIEALGGSVTNFEGVQVGDTDFRAALAKIGANRPELIFFGGYATEAALIATQMRESPGLEETLFMSDDGAYTEQYLTAAGAAAEGTYASFVAGATDQESTAAFDAQYLEKYGVTPDSLGPFHYQSYDTVLVIAAAIERVAQVDGSGNLVIDREDLIRAIRQTQGLEGLTGSLTCNEIGECGAGGVQIFQVVDGKFQQVAGFGLD